LVVFERHSAYCDYFEVTAGPLFHLKSEVKISTLFSKLKSSLLPGIFLPAWV